MTLRTSATNTYWFDTVDNQPEYLSLAHDMETDVAIVGGGIHGIVAAYLLAQAGLKVILLEQNRIGSGDTGHTTAFVSYVIDEDLSGLYKTVGKANAARIWESCSFATSSLATLVATEMIDCDLKKVPLKVFATDHKDTVHLQQEIKFANSLGFNLKWHPASDLSIKNLGYFSAPNHLKFHPLKFLYGLARKATERGVMIFEQTPVISMEHGQQVKLKTYKGMIKANYLISASGAPINSPYFLQSKIKPSNSYVIAGTLPKRRVEEGLYLDSQDPYHYLRIDAATSSDRFLLGGEDHPTGKKETSTDRFEKLMNYMKEYISKDFTITHRWGGQILTSMDGLPYIGAHPLHKNEFVGTCFGGDGMTFGVLSAMINTDLIVRGKHAFADLYRPARFSGFVNLMKHGVTMAKATVKSHLPLSTKDFSQLKSGQGIVVKKDGQKVAVSRNEKGEIIAVSAICPHMGCTVNWNETEKTWDCPCHGSRFEHDGSLLGGPATKPLDHIEL